MMIGTTARRWRSARATSWPAGPGPEGDVEQDDVEVALGRLRDRRLAVGHGRHAVALALERAREHLAQRLVVVDDEDVERRGGLHALTVAPRAGHRTRATGLARQHPILVHPCNQAGFTLVTVHGPPKEWTPKDDLPFGQDGRRRRTRQRADGSDRRAPPRRRRTSTPPVGARPCASTRRTTRACSRPLTPPEVAAGLTSTAAAASPDRRSLYVVNQASDDVSQFDIAVRRDAHRRRRRIPSHRHDRRSPSPSLPTARTPTSPTRATTRPSARTTSTPTGALTLASSAATGDGPLQIALSPDGVERLRHELLRRHGLAVRRQRDGCAHAEDCRPPSRPARSRRASRSAPTAPASTSPTRCASGTVAQFSIDADERRSRPTSRAPVAAGSQPRGVVAAADRVYVANVGADTISQYDGRRRRRAEPSSRPPSPAREQPVRARARRPTARACTSPPSAAPPSASTTWPATERSRVKAAARPAGFRPQAVVAVKPRDEQAPTIDLRTPPEGAPVPAGRRRRRRLLVRRRGRLGPRVVHRRRADGAPLDTSTPGDACLHGRRARRRGQRDRR